MIRRLWAGQKRAQRAPWIAAMLAAALVLGLCGCGTASAEAETGEAAGENITETAGPADTMQTGAVASPESPTAGGAETADGAAGATDTALKFIIASDLHYISPAINDNGPCFQQLMAEADGKVTVYCEELTDAFLSEVIAAQPDALILTGDLSFNGALESHKALAEKLAEVEAAGIPVLVTTGNHDVYCGSAASFSGDDYTLLPETTSAQFEEVYRAYGYDDAESRDDASLSYFYRLNDSVAFLVLDFNTEGHECKVLDETLQWAEKTLKQAQKENLTVIGIGHQNLFQHSMFDYGYVVSGTQDLQRLFQKYGVQLFFSGHMHIQHMMETLGVTEIASSALSVTPLQYGVLTVDGQGMEYETRKVDVNTWAAANGSTDENLLHFDAFAVDTMDEISRPLSDLQLAGTDITEEDRARMADYFCAVNRAYFAGDLTTVFTTENAYELHRLWTGSGTTVGTYMLSLESEIGKDYTHWSSN